MRNITHVYNQCAISRVLKINAQYCTCFKFFLLCGRMDLGILFMHLYSHSSECGWQLLVCLSLSKVMCRHIAICSSSVSSRPPLCALLQIMAPLCA